jgi:hypothetical protein
MAGLLLSGSNGVISQKVFGTFSMMGKNVLEIIIF